MPNLPATTGTGRSSGRRACNPSSGAGPSPCRLSFTNSLQSGQTDSDCPDGLHRTAVPTEIAGTAVSLALESHSYDAR